MSCHHIILRIRIPECVILNLSDSIFQNPRPKVTNYQTATLATFYLSFGRWSPSPGVFNISDVLERAGTQLIFHLPKSQACATTILKFSWLQPLSSYNRTRAVPTICNQFGASLFCTTNLYISSSNSPVVLERPRTHLILQLPESISAATTFRLCSHRSLSYHHHDFEEWATSAVQRTSDLVGTYFYEQPIFICSSSLANQGCAKEGREMQVEFYL